MIASQEDQIHMLFSIECEQKLFGLIVSFAHELGFDYCAYGLRMPLPLTQPKIAIFNNYPVAWQNHYQAENYLTVDPTVKHGIRSLLPVLWSESLFSSAPELWKDARSFGLQVGWAQANRDINGAGGLLTLARSGKPISEVELQAKCYKMTWLAQMAHIAMSQCLTKKMALNSMVKLSNREIEVLRWTGDGKAVSDISDILNISVSTVNFHIANVITKLNTPNKTAAVIQAVLLGLLN